MPIAPITAPTVAPGPLFANELDTPLATLTNAINAIIAVVNTLSAAAAPDLSGYATTGALSAHVASADAHVGFLRTLVSPYTTSGFVQFFTGTVNAATPRTITYPTTYAHVAYPFVSSGGDDRIWVNAPSLGGCIVTSPSAGFINYYLMVIGW